jgi:hypothetical protein
MAQLSLKTKASASQQAKQVSAHRKKFFDNYCTMMENDGSNASILSIRAQQKKSLWAFKTVDSNLCLAVKIKADKDQNSSLLVMGKIISINFSTSAIWHDGFLSVNISDIHQEEGYGLHQVFLLVKYLDLKFADSTTKTQLKKNLIDINWAEISLNDQRNAAKTLSKDLKLSIIVRLNPITPLQREDEHMTIEGIFFSCVP